MLLAKLVARRARVQAGRRSGDTTIGRPGGRMVLSSGDTKVGDMEVGNMEVGQYGGRAIWRSGNMEVG